MCVYGYLYEEVCKKCASVSYFIFNFHHLTSSFRTDCFFNSHPSAALCMAVSLEVVHWQVEWVSFPLETPALYIIWSSVPCGQLLCMQLCSTVLCIETKSVFLWWSCCQGTSLNTLKEGESTICSHWNKLQCSFVVNDLERLIVYTLLVRSNNFYCFGH